MHKYNICQCTFYSDRQPGINGLSPPVSPSPLHTTATGSCRLRWEHGALAFRTVLSCPSQHWLYPTWHSLCYARNSAWPSRPQVFEILLASVSISTNVLTVNLNVFMHAQRSEPPTFNNGLSCLSFPPSPSDVPTVPQLEVVAHFLVLAQSERRWMCETRCRAAGATVALTKATRFECRLQ